MSGGASTDDELVTLNLTQYRRLVKGSAKRLGALPPFDPNVDRITLGRAAGCDLALSYLDECIIRKKDDE